MSKQTLKRDWQKVSEHLQEELRLCRDEVARLEARLARHLAGNPQTEQETTSADVLDQLRAERNAALRQANDLTFQIDSAHDIATQLAEEAGDALETQWEQFSSEIDEFRVPAHVYLLGQAAQAVEDTMVGSQRDAAHRLASPGGNNPDQILRDAIRLAEVAGARYVVASLMTELRAEAGNPHLICYMIMEQLTYRGEADVQTVRRLPLEWVKANISDRIGTHETLQRALTHAYRYHTQYRSKDKSKVAYHLEHHISEESLRKYTRYLNGVKTAARALPQDFEDFFSTLRHS